MQKQKRKEILQKAKVWLLVIAVCFAGGFVFGNALNSFPKLFFTTPGWAKLLLFVASYGMSIVLHELAHFAAFRLQGVAMRALVAVCVAVVKTNGKWRVRLHLDPITALGGMAVPDLPVVHTMEDFRRLQKKYANAILAAPLVSLGIGVVSLAAAVWLVFLPQTAGVNALFFWCVFNAAIALLLNISSLAKSDLAYGDYPAYRICKTDDFFMACQLYDYLTFAQDGQQKQRESTFLRDMLDTELAQRAQTGKLDAITANALTNAIMEYLVGKTAQVCDGVRQFQAKLEPRTHELLDKKRGEQVQLLFVHLTLLAAANDPAQAKALWEKHSDALPDTPVFRYYRLQVRQLVYGEDHRETLLNKTQIKPTAAWKLWSLFDGFYVEPLQLNQIVDLHAHMLAAGGQGNEDTTS